MTTPQTLTRIILASGSAVRAKLLQAASVAFRVIPSPADEDALKPALRARGLAPAEQAAALADAKALAVAKDYPEFVIGADQILEFKGETVDKAKTIVEARERLWRMRGHAHQLHAAITLTKSGTIIWRTTSTATLWMHEFSEQYLEDYLQRAGSGILSSVGCYQLENEGIRLFSKIEGDYFAILGLPIIELLNALHEHGAIER